MDGLLGIVKSGVAIAVIVFVLAAIAVAYGLRLHYRDQRREQRDKILNASLDDLAEKKAAAADANGEPTNKNPHSNRQGSNR